MKNYIQTKYSFLLKVAMLSSVVIIFAFFKNSKKSLDGNSLILNEVKTPVTNEFLLGGTSIEE